MTIAELEKKFTKIGEYVTTSTRDSADGLSLYVEINDFLGFSADGEEIYSTLDIEAVDKIVEEMKKEAASYTMGMYPVFEFKGFKVCISYTSYDI